MREARRLGIISQVWRYPVKSLAPESLACVMVDRQGLDGDRRQAIVVRSGHARVGRPYRGKEHERLHLQHRAADAIALAAERRVDVALADDGPYFDLDPVSLIFDTWLRDGERLVGRPLEAQRYRPNFMVRAEAEFVESEAALVDRVLAIGDLQLRVTAPIQRCVTPSYDLTTGERDRRIATVIARERENTMGIYAQVLRPARVCVGDAILMFEA